MKVTKENLVDLIVKMWEFGQFQRALSELRVDIDVTFAETYDIILDMMGFPKDSWNGKKQTGFCRDCLSDILYISANSIEECKIAAGDAIDKLIEELKDPELLDFMP